MSRTLARGALAATLALSPACASAPVDPPRAEAPKEAPKPAAPVEAQKPARLEVSGPGKVTFASGATLEVPPSFVAVHEGERATLLEPDRRVETFLFELDGEDNAAAIRAAWKKVDPQFDAPMVQELEPPAKDGWSGTRVENYAPDAAGRVAQAVARRFEKKIWVSLLRGTPADLDRRAAQLLTFIGSLTVPGKKVIDLAATTPTPLGERAKELDQFIEGLLRDTGTPGFQLAIVEGGKVVHAKGFGVRELGKPAKVDADTLMMIGSVSKSFTTLLMAKLVDQKKLAWDAPVTSVMKGFKLGDAALTEKLKVEELVCACAGLPRKDLPLILEFEKKKPESVFAELATLAPSTGLRETFQYQNHMVAAGGYLAARVYAPEAPLGMAFDRAMKSEIFSPLGMRRTTLELDAAKRDPNHARPHAMDLEGAHQPVNLEHERFATFIRPSGGIWSSANELARYALHELGKGELDGKRIVSAESLTHRWQPQVKINADASYGLGWIVEKYKGLTVLSHGGGTMGFATSVVLVPEKNLGVVMIANGTGGHLMEGTIRKRLFELWFGVDEQSAASVQTALESQKTELAELKLRARAPDASFADKLLGAHDNPELGRFVISKKGDEYRLDAGVYQTRLWQHAREDGKTTLLFRDPALAGLELVPSETEGESFELVRAQERYPFRPVAGR